MPLDISQMLDGGGYANNLMISPGARNNRGVSSEIDVKEKNKASAEVENNNEGKMETLSLEIEASVPSF